MYTLLAERLGVRGWPVAVAWAVVFPVVYILEVALWGIGTLGRPDVPAIGAVVLIFVLWTNDWYFPQLEDLVNIPNSQDKQLHLPPISRGAKIGLRGDIAAVLLWGFLTFTAIMYDWQIGNLCWFSQPAALRPWGCFVSGLVRIGYSYLTLVGLSLLFHYSGRWKLLGNWVTNSKPPLIPKGTGGKEWVEWRRLWYLYCERMKEISELFFFKGFLRLLLVVSTITWAWLLFWLWGWTSVFNPTFIASLVLVGGSVVTYLLGPSISAGRKIEKVQATLRKRAHELMISYSGAEEEFPSLSDTLLNLSRETIFSSRHGTPKAAVGAFVSYFAPAIALIRLFLG